MKFSKRVIQLLRKTQHINEGKNLFFHIKPIWGVFFSHPSKKRESSGPCAAGPDHGCYRTPWLGHGCYCHGCNCPVVAPTALWSLSLQDLQQWFQHIIHANSAVHLQTASEFPWRKPPWISTEHIGLQCHLAQLLNVLSHPFLYFSPFVASELLGRSDP